MLSFILGDANDIPQGLCIELSPQANCPEPSALSTLPCYIFDELNGLIQLDLWKNSRQTCFPEKTKSMMPFKR